MTINTRELSLLLQEASALSNKPSWTKQDERRNAFLLASISAVKAGASLVEIEQDNFNAESRRNGLPVTNFKKGNLNVEQRATAAAWQHFVKTPKEQRDVEGAPMLTGIGTYTSLGHFVPTEFFNQLFMQMKQHDPLFNEDDCTVINSVNGRPLQVPTVGDIENVADVIGEAAADNSPTDLAAPGQANVGVYSYRSPRWTCSMEAFEDLEASFTATGLFQRFASDRLRRGIGRDLINGNGVGKTLGLVPSIAALNSSATPIVHAVGSAGNTGGAETSANSIGSADLAALFYSVDAAYRSSDKCCWLMQDSTLAYLAGLISKQGLPLVNWQGGEGYILGKPVKVSPSVDPIGNSNIPVIFGDLSFWITRLVTGEQNGFASQYIQRYTEAPGLIENGLVGFRAFMRAGGVLAVNDPNSPSPINAIRNAHS